MKVRPVIQAIKKQWALLMAFAFTHFTDVLHIRYFAICSASIIVMVSLYIAAILLRYDLERENVSDINLETLSMIKEGMLSAIVLLCMGLVALFLPVTEEFISWFLILSYYESGLLYLKEYRNIKKEKYRDELY